jgi:hypothetical protein
MTYSLYFDATGYDSEIATTTGLGDLRAWIEGLDANMYPLLAELASEGAAAPIAELGNQLEAALDDSPPDDKTVARTARNLLVRIDAHLKTDEVAVISDGVGVEDDEEGEE